MRKHWRATPQTHHSLDAHYYWSLDKTEQFDWVALYGLWFAVRPKN
ncbi:hypothetical protein [Roseovarius aestuarii]|nr:hypothetical protein [Roseovarius aestuarii]